MVEAVNKEGGADVGVIRSLRLLGDQLIWTKHRSVNGRALDSCHRTIAGRGSLPLSGGCNKVRQQYIGMIVLGFSLQNYSLEPGKYYPMFYGMIMWTGDI